MTERQDLRPLSTEDLLTGHDRTHVDDRDSTDTTDTTDQYRDDDQYRTDTDVDRDTTGATDTTDATDRHDVDADADRPVVSDQHDDVDVDAENRQPDGSERYDGQTTSLDGTDARGQATPAEAVVVQQPAASTTTQQESTATLFTGEEVDQYRTEWRGLQSDFVDSPRDAVQHADQLVAQVMQSLAKTFTDHKKSLESQWSKGEQVETEELRVALRQYRAFFDKLLTV